MIRVPIFIFIFFLGGGGVISQPNQLPSRSWCKPCDAPDKSEYSYFSTKTYVVGPQKYRLNETYVKTDG